MLLTPPVLLPPSNALSRLAFPMRHVVPMRRAYLVWLNHVAGGVSMNMIATKPARFVGRHEGMGTAQRLARLLAACLRLPLDRLRGKSPKRLPRTPEQAARAMRGWA